MIVLIVERDAFTVEIFSDALAEDGVTAEITADDEQAIDACHDSSTRVMITGINRHGEDMKSMQFGRAMRARGPLLAVIYLAALWPVKLKDAPGRSCRSPFVWIIWSHRSRASS
jgi:DNA-binding NtrC family response regulator